MKILSVVGARPEFIQAAPLSRAMKAAGQSSHFEEILIHTGQHYDYSMSQAFFEELEIPAPHYNLGVGSNHPGRQVGQMLAQLEEVIEYEKPSLVVVRGDTNSTLAGALATSKLHIPLAHLEAGERSYDRRMPEEINRIVTDRVADLHFCASQTAVRNLAKEGITTSVHFVGDVLLDALMDHLPIARLKSDVLNRLMISPRSYSLVTIHRAANTDDPERLEQLIRTINQAPGQIIFPAHPRTRLAMERYGIVLGPQIYLVDPLSYYDMLVIEENACMIATDSGGVQREAYFLGIPCLTLRDETEWTETVETGWNRLVGVKPGKILENWVDFYPPSNRPPLFGDGKASRRIVEILAQEVK